MECVQNFLKAQVRVVSLHVARALAGGEVVRDRREGSAGAADDGRAAADAGGAGNVGMPRLPPRAEQEIDDGIFCWRQRLSRGGGSDCDGAPRGALVDWTQGDETHFLQVAKGRG